MGLFDATVNGLQQVKANPNPSLFPRAPSGLQRLSARVSGIFKGAPFGNDNAAGPHKRRAVEVRSTPNSKFVDMGSLDLLPTTVNDGGAVDRYKKAIIAGEQVGPIQLLKPQGGTGLTLQDGNHRLQAMRELGVKMVPVQTLEVDSDFRIKDITHEWEPVKKGAPFGNDNAKGPHKMHRGVGDGSSDSGVMTWVTPDRDLAQGYANKRINGRVDTVDAPLKNTFDAGHDARELTPSQFAIQAMTKARGISDLTDKQMLALRSEFVKDQGKEAVRVSDLWADEDGKKRVASLLTGLGFDSLHLTEEGKPTYGLLKKGDLSQSDLDIAGRAEATMVQRKKRKPTLADFERLFKGAPFGNQNARKNKSGTTGLTGDTSLDPNKTWDGKDIPTHTVDSLYAKFGELKGKGIDCEFTPEEFHRRTMGRVDPVELVKAIWGEDEYRKGQISGASIVEHTGGVSYEHLKGRISIGGSGRVHGSKVTWVERCLSTDMQSIDHTFLEMYKGQGNNGTARTLFDKSVPLYKKMGLKAITVHANLEGGAYAWNKFGFAADHLPHVRESVEKGWADIVKRANEGIPREDRVPLSKDAKKEMDTLRTILASDDPHMGMRLVNLETPNLDAHFGHVYGAAKDQRIPNSVPMSFIKTAMSGKNWNATHRLNDVEAANQLKSYLRTPPKKKTTT